MTTREYLGWRRRVLRPRNRRVWDREARAYVQEVAFYTLCLVAYGVIVGLMMVEVWR